MSGLRIGQINLGHTSCGGAEVEMAAVRLNLDVICIQEPYLAYGKFTGVSSTCRVVMGEGLNPSVAILILNPSIDYVVLGQAAESWMVTIEIDHRGFRFYLLSVYCRPSENLGGQLESAL